MRPCAHLLTLGALASTVAAQGISPAPVVGATVSQRDTAFIFIAVAEAVADSLPIWYPRKSFQLDIPQFPRNAGLQGSLAGALGRRPYLLNCEDLVHCARSTDEVVRLDSLRHAGGDSVEVSIGLPSNGWHWWEGTGGPGTGGQSWTSVEWAIAAENGLFLDMRVLVTGGCTNPQPRLAVLTRNSSGWHLVHVDRGMRVCA